MSRWRQTAKWLVRVGVATAIFAAVAMLANPGRAMAAGALDELNSVSATRAVLIFLAVWFVASLRLGRVKGRWRLEFSPAVVRRSEPGGSSRSRPRNTGSHSSDGVTGNY